MASLRQIRRRMKSIQNIHEITKAMEMIAAFRFKRAENRFAKSKVYLTEMERLLARLSSGAKEIQEPCLSGRQALFEKRSGKKKALVVMTGDKGLCGAYNANLVRGASGWLRQNGDHAFVIPVGKVGYEFFRRKKAPVIGGYPERSMVDFSFARTMTEELKKLFLDKKVDSIEILYTSYRAGGAGRNEFAPLLSLSYLADKKEGVPEADYIFEKDFESVFVALLSRYLEAKIYITLLESLTSEYSARMVAMKQATENGEEVLDSLKLLRNKTRQATITRELSEIVSGASALA